MILVGTNGRGSWGVRSQIEIITHWRWMRWFIGENCRKSVSVFTTIPDWLCVTKLRNVARIWYLASLRAYWQTRVFPYFLLGIKGLRGESSRRMRSTRPMAPKAVDRSRTEDSNWKRCLNCHQMRNIWLSIVSFHGLGDAGTAAIKELRKLLSEEASYRKSA